MSMKKSSASQEAGTGIGDRNKPQTVTNTIEQEPKGEKKDYIGCLMSLISKQEIRYVGTLVVINSKEQTLILKDVKSYGSEGRRKGGSDEVPPSAKVYEHIVFRAQELKDFSVIKSPEKGFKDPAILSNEEKKKDEIKKYGEEEHMSLKTPEKEMPEAAFHYNEERESSGRVRRTRGYRNYYSRSRGSPRRIEGAYREHSNEEIKEKYEKEFDFEGMNKKFQSLFSEKDEKISVGSKYDKGKSFYDGISRGAEEKTESTYDRQKQRQIDAATFDLDQDYRGRGDYNPRYHSRGRYQGPSYGRGRYTEYRGYPTHTRRVQYYRKKI